MRRAHVIAIAVVAALAVVVVGGAWAYDHGRQDTIVAGVKIGGVDVGGLTAAQAQARIERRLLDPLREPIVIRRGTRSWRLGAKEAQIAADVQGSVGAAMDAGRDGSFLARTWRSLTGGEESTNLQPELTFNDHAVVRLIDRVRRVVDKTRARRERQLHRRQRRAGRRPSRAHAAGRGAAPRHPRGDRLADRRAHVRRAHPPGPAEGHDGGARAASTRR